MDKLERKYNKCLKDGFEPSIKGCEKIGTKSLTKKRRKKCAKKEEKLKNCGYTCKATVKKGWYDTSIVLSCVKI
jgi:hypothetical protein